MGLPPHREPGVMDPRDHDRKVFNKATDTDYFLVGEKRAVAEKEVPWERLRSVRSE